MLTSEPHIPAARTCTSTSWGWGERGAGAGLRVIPACACVLLMANICEFMSGDTVLVTQVVTPLRAKNPSLHHLQQRNLCQSIDYLELGRHILPAGPIDRELGLLGAMVFDDPQRRPTDRGHQQKVHLSRIGAAHRRNVVVVYKR